MGVEGVISAVVDQWPNLLRRGYRKEIFIGVVCVFNFLIGLSMVSRVSRVMEKISIFNTILVLLKVPEMIKYRMIFCSLKTILFNQFNTSFIGRNVRLPTV